MCAHNLFVLAEREIDCIIEIIQYYLSHSGRLAVTCRIFISVKVGSGDMEERREKENVK